MKLKRTLLVTSPLMHGDDVRHAQRMLNSTAEGTKYGNYNPGGDDGYFGKQSGAACKRAKYWLGYPREAIRATYGQTLENLLGGADLPADFRRRRSDRLRIAAEKPDNPLRVRAFRNAVSQIGVKESPENSNRVKFSAWYGIIGPWCAMFVTWCYEQEGSKTFSKGSRYAYVPFMVEDARGRDMRMVKIGMDDVRQGDIVTFDWNGGGMTGRAEASDHTGLFDEWINKGAGTFRTVEGNTSFGSNSNGGQVMRRERHMSEVSCFMRADV